MRLFNFTQENYDYGLFAADKTKFSWYNSVYTYSIVSELTLPFKKECARVSKLKYIIYAPKFNTATDSHQSSGPPRSIQNGGFKMAALVLTTLIIEVQ